MASIMATQIRTALTINVTLIFSLSPAASLSL